MTDPIIVPIAAPGATEAAAQTRTFARSVGETAMAHEKLTAAEAKGATAAKGEAAATEQANQVHRRHVRTLEEEIIVQQRLEHQRKVTAAAKAALGESADAGNIGAFRRFGRSLGAFGGVGREIGRGSADLMEAGEGSGLKAGLGMAGAGLAGGMILFEGIRSYLEHFNESVKFAAETGEQIAEAMRNYGKRVGEMGKAAQDEHGTALRTLDVMGGPGATAMAKRSAAMNKDPSAVEAYADALRRFGQGGQLNTAMSFAADVHRFTGESMSAVEGKLQPGQVQLMRNRGRDQALADYLSTPGHRVTLNDVKRMRSNISNPSATVKAIDANDANTTTANLAGIDQIPASVALTSKDAADASNPEMASLRESLEKNRKPLQDAMRRAKDWTDWNTNPLTKGVATVVQGVHGIMEGAGLASPNPWAEVRELTERNRVIAEQLRALGEAAHKTAASLDSSGGSKQQLGASSTP